MRVSYGGIKYRFCFYIRVVEGRREEKCERENHDMFYRTFSLCCSRSAII